MRKQPEGMCTHGMQSTEGLRQSEPTFSAIAAVALEKLCFGNDFNASIVHQGPISKKQGHPDAADMCGIRFLQGEK